MKKQYRLSLVVLLFSPVLLTTTQAMQEELFFRTIKIRETIVQTFSPENMERYLNLVFLISHGREDGSKTHNPPSLISQEEAIENLYQLKNQWLTTYPQKGLPCQNDFDIDNTIEHNNTLELAYTLLYIETKIVVDFLSETIINDLDEKMKLLELIITIHDALRLTPPYTTTPSSGIRLRPSNALLLSTKLPKNLRESLFIQKDFSNAMFLLKPELENRTNFLEFAQDTEEKRIVFAEIFERTKEEHRFYSSLIDLTIQRQEEGINEPSVIGVPQEELEPLYQNAFNTFIEYYRCRALVPDRNTFFKHRSIVLKTFEDCSPLGLILCMSYQSLLYVFGKKRSFPKKRLNVLFHNTMSVGPTIPTYVRTQLLYPGLFSLKTWADSIDEKMSIREDEKENQDEKIKFLLQNGNPLQKINFLKYGREAIIRSFRSLSQ